MKIALFTGTAYRHLFYANTIAEAADVVLHVKTIRSNVLTDEIPDSEFNQSDRQLLKAHSDLRLAKEKEYFLPKADETLHIPVSFEVSMKDLNSVRVIEAIVAAKPDVVLVYGTGLLKEALLAVMPKWLINLHAGLSPYYRGAATLYWPIYFMQPQSVGFTLHLIDKDIDHGAILHQNRPDIKADDSIHDLGCRTIVVAANDVLKLLPLIEKDEIQSRAPTTEGRIFYERDFKPYHLRVTNALMKQKLFREYLENRHLFPDPKIVQQLTNENLIVVPFRE